MKRLSHSERVQRKLVVNDVTGCWEFSGHRNVGGYGEIAEVYLDAVTGLPRRRNILCHRVMAEAAFGPCPDGMVVRHKCDNRVCCRPEHLEYGSHSQNVEDARRRGRYLTGELHPSARLSDADAREIFLSLDETRVVARRYGISPATVAVIRNGMSRREATRGLVRPVRLVKLSREVARAIFLSEGSYADTAKRFGVSVSVVNRLRCSVSYAEWTRDLRRAPLRKRANASRKGARGRGPAQLDLFD